MKRVLRALGALALGAALFAPSDADACGGCFVPPSENTVVTGHRMAMSISPTQSVLWDQIQYAGDPKDFAWVLPVKPGAVVEVSTDAWFETLEAATGVQITAPPVNCGSASSGFGCGASADDSGAFAESASGKGTVQVLHEGTVGPYETVTLKTATPGALNDWLSEHGYTVDDATQPIIDAYVAEGFDFIALKLQPGAGVRQMKPVRIITPGAAATLPLRMVAAGTGANVAIVLYVIGEGRWTTDNFPTATIPIDLLSWDMNTNESNYGELRDKVLAAGDGRGWLAAYARKNALFLDMNSPNSFSPSGPTVFHNAYVAQGVSNGEIAEACTLPNLSGETAVVVDPCPPGVPFDDPSCESVVEGVDARQLACGVLDDIAVALTGMHPQDVWVTRLESNLPRAALATDLTLEAAERQVEVSNFLQARIAVHAEEYCGSATPVLRSDGDTSRTRTLVVGAGLFVMAVAAMRRRRRYAVSSAA